jgi:hypothetical protein
MKTMRSFISRDSRSNWINEPPSFSITLTFVNGSTRRWRWAGSSGEIWESSSCMVWMGGIVVGFLNKASAGGPACPHPRTGSGRAPPPVAKFPAQFSSVASATGGAGASTSVITAFERRKFSVLAIVTSCRMRTNPFFS